MITRLVEQLRRLSPIVGQLTKYDREQARGDLVAGLTVAVLLVPQSMAYAMLAGLDPIVGLYASTLPLLAYALFGSSPHLSIGPVALVSIVIAEGVTPLAQPGSDLYFQYAVMLAVIVGALQLFMAVARLGFIVDFLSHPVIIGFSSAAALVIAGSQVGPATGLEISRTHRLDIIGREVVAQVGDIHGVTLAIFLGSLALLVGIKRIAPRAPRALIAVGLAAIAVWVLDLDQRGVAVIGEIPAGLPALAMPPFSLDAVSELWPAALTALLVGFVEAYSIAKVLSRGDTEKRIQPNRELFGLGLANMASAVVGGYPVGGALSRTTVAHRSGARTLLASLIAGATVIVTLAVLTPAFRLLPKAALSAVIVVAVMSLVNIKELARLYRISRRDFALAGVTILATFTLGVEWGVLCGVTMSLIVFMSRMSRPAIMRLTKTRTRDGVHWIETKPDDDPLAKDAIMVLRVRAPVFFANARHLQERVRQRLEGESEVPVTAIVIDATAIDHVDASAEIALRELSEELSERGIQMHIAGLTDEAAETLEQSGLLEDLSGQVHAGLDRAIEAARRASRMPLHSAPGE